MQLLRDLLLRRKLMLIMMLSSFATLFVACLAWLYCDWRFSREAQVRQLSLLGDIIGANVSSAIEFADREKIEKDLLMLATRPSIRKAAVFDEHGLPLACYAAQSVREHGQLPFQPPGEYLEDDGLEVYVPIYAASERLGTVGLESDLAEI